jgi:hypothetical protein
LRRSIRRTPSIMERVARSHTSAGLLERAWSTSAPWVERVLPPLPSTLMAR